MRQQQNMIMMTMRCRDKDIGRYESWEPFCIVEQDGFCDSLYNPISNCAGTSPAPYHLFLCHIQKSSGCSSKGRRR